MSVFIEMDTLINYHIVNGLFVDDMMHIYSCDPMKDEFPGV